MTKRRGLIVLLIFSLIFLLVSRKVFQPASGDQSEAIASPSPNLDASQVGRTVETVNTTGREPDDMRDGRDVAGVSSPGSKKQLTGVQISGVVVKQDTGEPVSGAQVFILPFSQAVRPKQSQVLSAMDGRFSFRDRFRGDYLIYAALEPMISFENRGDIEMIRVRPHDKDMGPVRLEMRTAQEMKVRVIDGSDQQPVVGASLKARGQLYLNFTTNERGIARMGLSPGIWSLDILARGYVPRTAAVSLNGGQQPVTLALTPGATFFGKILDEEGTPIEGAELAISSGHIDLEAVSDSTGEFLLDSIPKERAFSVGLLAKGFKNVFIPGISFAKDQPEKELDFTMVSLDSEEGELVQIEGQVVDTDQQPIAGARISLGPQAETVSGVDGRFFLECETTAATILLRVDARGYSSKMSHVRLNEPPMVLVLEPPYSLSGKVQDAWGTPLGKVSVTGLGYGVSGQIPMALFDGSKQYTDENGHFSFQGLPAIVELTFATWGYLPRREVVDLGLKQEVTVTLDAMGTLLGKVIDDKTNRPIEAFSIQVKKLNERGLLAIDNTWSREGIRFWSPKGEFHIERLPPLIELELIVSAEGYPKTRFNVVAEPERDAAPQTLALSAQNGIEVAGKLVDAQGQARALVPVRLLVYDSGDPYNARFTWSAFFRGIWKSKTQAVLEATTTSDGSFSFSGVPKDAKLDLLIDHQGLATSHFNNIHHLNGVPNNTWQVFNAAEIVANIDLDDFPGRKRINIKANEPIAFYRPYIIEKNLGYVQLDRIPPGQYNVEILSWANPSQAETLYKGEFNLNPGQVFEIELIRE